jgi:predicted  nucleic acid-binding Zn-ribbon protein
MDQKEALRALQDADLVILRAKTRYDNLPEKEQLVKVREKIHAALVKAGQASDLRSECEDDIKRCQHEDDMLKDKIAENQKKLDNTSNHRLIAGLTKEMEGSVKRREKVDFQMGELFDRLQKIEELEAQVKEAADKLDVKEAELSRAVKEYAEEMARTVTEAQARRKEAAAALDKDLLDRYAHLARTKGGIAVASYRDSRCSACNVEFHEGERQRIENDAEISTCPRCGRLLIRDSEREEAR